MFCRSAEPMGNALAVAVQGFEGLRVQVRYLKAILIAFLLVWTLGTILLPASSSHAAEIVGHWVTKSQTDNDINFFFESEGDFFIENETSWIQGTYIDESDSVTGQLDLYVQDGSNVEDIGKEARYDYDIHDNLLTLSETAHDGTDLPSTLDMGDPTGRYVVIGINTDPTDEYNENDKDDQDNDWVVYANCFVEVLAGIPVSP